MSFNVNLTVVVDLDVATSDPLPVGGGSLERQPAPRR
jgi:hypothetical protein